MFNFQDQNGGLSADGGEVSWGKFEFYALLVSHFNYTFTIRCLSSTGEDFCDFFRKWLRLN